SRVLPVVTTRNSSVSPGWKRNGYARSIVNVRSVHELVADCVLLLLPTSAVPFLYSCTYTSLLGLAARCNHSETTICWPPAIMSGAARVESVKSAEPVNVMLVPELDPCATRLRLRSSYT